MLHLSMRATLAKKQRPESYPYPLGSTKVDRKQNKILLSKSIAITDDIHKSLLQEVLSGRTFL